MNTISQINNISNNTNNIATSNIAISYTNNNYENNKVSTLDKEHYYDNINNVIPNPLYKNIINHNYSNSNYATSDLNGEENTKYLKRSKTNISNIIQQDFYIPSIGELGISMENIQTINNAIKNLGEKYEQYIISEDKVFASSTLHNNEHIINKEYQMTNNLNNVWNFDMSKAKISYSPIENKFNILQFYKFENNVLTELDMNNEDIILNSLSNYIDYTMTDHIGDVLYYCEYNAPVHNVPGNDFTLENWVEYPFSAKYFFTINFNNGADIVKYNLMNFSYTFKSRNIFENNDEEINDEYIENEELDNEELDNEEDSEEEIYTRIGYFSNNGVNYINNPDGFSYLSSYIYLYYNLPIYNNNLVLIPNVGSGENNYNVQKRIAVCEIYVAVPKLVEYFKVNIKDCDIYSRIFIDLGPFDIYYIKLTFKKHYPSSNIIEFIAKYNSVKYSKKYFFTIYGFNVSNILSSNNNLTSYISINNFYVAKDSYFWWNNINNTKVINDNNLNGLFCYKDIVILNNENNESLLGVQGIYKQFLENNSHYFKSNYDISYLINNISNIIDIGYASAKNRGLRVERIIDKDTIIDKLISGNNINSDGFLFPYNIQSISGTMATNQTICISSSDFTPENYNLLEKNWWLFKYSYYDVEEEHYKLTNKYHLFNIMSYHFYEESKLKFDNPSNKNYNCKKYIYKNCNDLINYLPVLRINRTKDEYGINNDLMFAYLYNAFSINNNPFVLNNGNWTHNAPIEHFCFKKKKSNTKDLIQYYNLFKLNIPIVGCKESLCLNMTLNTEILRLFRDIEKHYYLYSDYIFIYNNTDSSKQILIDDESLSLVDCKNAIFNIESGELRVYYPNNFNYNATYKEFKHEIYNIKLYNRSNENINFNIINIGEFNIDIDKVINNKIYIEDLLGYKYVCHLLYLYDFFKDPNITDIYKSNYYKSNALLSIYNAIIKTKNIYNSNLLYYNDILSQIIYRSGNNTNNSHNTTYYIDNTYQYVINNVSLEDYPGIELNTSESDNFMLYGIPRPIKEDERYFANGNSETLSNMIQTEDYINKVTRLNLEHIRNLSESEINQEYQNYVNISIKDYSLNKAGYLIIIN